MLIIPPSPSPTPLDELELEDLTAAEMRELLRRERASYLSTVDVNGTNRSQEENAALRAVKREPKRTYGGTITDDDDEVQVTQERSAKRTRLSLNDDSGIDVVDLTQ